MDSRYLKSLIRVIECGSIADAARAEHLTAAAISQRIFALEKEFGFALLTRQGHAARPSAACLQILPRARHIVHEMELLAGDADTEGLTGTLRLGAISTALTGLMPAALRRLSNSAPKIRPQIQPGTSQHLYQALLADELDAVIIVAPAFALPKPLNAQLLRKEPLVLLSKQAAQPSIADTLQRHAYLRYDPLSWGGMLAEQYLQDQKLNLLSLWDLDALEAIAMLVDDAVGVSLVPYWSGLERIAGQSCITPIAGDAYTRKIILLSKSDNPRPQMLTVLGNSFGLDKV